MVEDNGKYRLRKYENTDYDFVYNVKKSSYRNYVVQCWGEWNEADQKKRFETFMRESSDRTFIIMLANERIGFYQGQIIDESTYYIENICIVEEYQNRGIGTEVLKSVIEKYSDRNIKIQYFKQNYVGKLYERLGFEPNGETEFHFQMIRKKR